MADVIVIGSCIVDLTFYTSSLPTAGQTVVGQFDSGLGGKGFNQAVASARSGASTLFIGAIGKDSFGEGFSKFKEKNLTIKLFKIPTRTTGAAAISVNLKGQNNIIVSLGANEALSLSHIKKFKAQFKKAKILLLQRENSDKLINEVIRFAKRINKNLTVVLNPAPCSGTVNITEQIDILTPNETELAFLSDAAIAYKHSIMSETLMKDIKEEDKKSNKIIKHLNSVVTLGHLGSAVFPHNQFFAPLKVEAVDTSGAGDAFNGGFVAGLIRNNFDIHKAIKYATIVAGLSVTKKGTSKSIPTFKEIQKIVRRLQ